MVGQYERNGRAACGRLDGDMVGEMARREFSLADEANGLFFVLVGVTRSFSVALAPGRAGQPAAGSTSAASVNTSKPSSGR